MPERINFEELSDREIIILTASKVNAMEIHQSEQNGALLIMQKEVYKAGTEIEKMKTRCQERHQEILPGSSLKKNGITAGKYTGLIAIITAIIYALIEYLPK